MTIHSDLAICLKRIDFSEHSQILSLLTRQSGPLRVIAKGLKRSTKTRVAVGVDLFEAGSVVWSAGRAGEGHLAILREWRQVEFFPDIRKDLGAVVAGQYAAEATLSLIAEGQPHQRLFDVMWRFLEHLGPGRRNLTLLVRFCWVLLSEAGLVPQWERCGRCSASVRDAEQRFFSPSAGGLVCPRCAGLLADRRQVSPLMASALRAARPERHPVEGFRLLDYYMACVLGRPLRCSSAVRWALLRDGTRKGTASGNQVRR